MSDKPKFPVPASRKIKGRALTRIDQEQKMINSGSLGSERLLINVAFDFMEKHPGMSWEQALVAAMGYCERTHN